jgi:hypothetical protein
MKAMSPNAIEATRVTLRLVPGVLDPVVVVSAFSGFPGMIYAAMSEPEDIQHALAHKDIGVDTGISLD